MNALPQMRTEANAGTTLSSLQRWADDTAALTRPDRIHWCDGSQAEYDTLLAQMQADGTLIARNPDTHPGCWLHRSDPNDVARAEHLTFVCHENEEDAGPNNHWMAPSRRTRRWTRCRRLHRDARCT